jgi:hypothetical protein
MRALLLLAVLTTPAHGWEAASEGALCTLTHTETDLHIRLTYDPGPPEYAIILTRAGTPWPVAPVFALQFTGDRPNLITTDRHVIDGFSLSVTDRGFGNVLDGLQFNRTATALTGDAAIPVPLTDAAPAVAAFRACTDAPSA